MSGADVNGLSTGGLRHLHSVAMTWDVVVGAASAVVGSLVGAWVTARATIGAAKRTIIAERQRLADERVQDAADAFDRVVKRATQQLLTARTMLGLTEKPSAPFFEFDHDALDLALSYSEFNVAVAFEVERAASALRRYNSAARWGNARYPMTGADGPAVDRWNDARPLVELALKTLADWGQVHRQVPRAPQEDPSGAPRPRAPDRAGRAGRSSG